MSLVNKVTWLQMDKSHLKDESVMFNMIPDCVWVSREGSNLFNIFNHLLQNSDSTK